jgi:hypothetical protein
MKGFVSSNLESLGYAISAFLNLDNRRVHGQHAVNSDSGA